MTWINTGLGFARESIESLAWDGLLPQAKYFHLVQPLDFDGDSKTDLLLPMVDAISPEVPRWVILCPRYSPKRLQHSVLHGA